MKERLQGVIIGLLIGVISLGGVVYATTGSRTIEVLYDNIKVYKDNVLCELKDANGTVVEPFIYNGTTYMPVRGTANLAGMDVTWDGNTKSVYLWDDMVASGTSFLEVCPPYAGNYDSVFLSSKGQSFEMSGEKYSDGIRFYWDEYALFNLNSKYSTLECTVGHDNYNVDREANISFIVDGKTIKTITLEPQCLPKKVSIPLTYGLQLKITCDTYAYIGSMIVK